MCFIIKGPQGLTQTIVYKIVAHTNEHLVFQSRFHPSGRSSFLSDDWKGTIKTYVLGQPTTITPGEETIRYYNQQPRATAGLFVWRDLEQALFVYEGDLAIPITRYLPGIALLKCRVHPNHFIAQGESARLWRRHETIIPRLATYSRLTPIEVLRSSP